jgi:hypothetical protein
VILLDIPKRTMPPDLCSQWFLGARHLRRADEVDLARYDPRPPLEWVG